MTMSSRLRELFDGVTARLAATGSHPLAEPPIAEMPIEDQLERAHGIEYFRTILGYGRHARLTPEQTQRLERELMTANLDEVLSLYPDDRMLSAFVLNLWGWAQVERAHGIDYARRILGYFQHARLTPEQLQRL